jgi:8-oxo-dGTP diphosphatase
VKILANLLDNQFPSSPIKENRDIARALVFDEEGHFAFHHIKGNDIFGLRDYYETPGGGVDKGENELQAVKRECYEEIGYQIQVVAEIGEVIDYYNLIGRKNLSHYYLAKRVGPFLGRHFVSKGDSMIEKTIWISLEKAEELYNSSSITPIARLVYAREVPVIKEAELLIKEGKVDIITKGKK